MTRGTPASSQIVWLEGRVAELEEQNAQLLKALKQLVIATQHLQPCPGTLDIAERAIKAAEELK